jgi:tRNA G18 (ribose-2'-O)-methylase SpoU
VNASPVQNITSLDDSRINNYRNLRERDLRAEGVFITEGALLAERLLQSRFAVESLFVTAENAERYADLLQGRAPLFVAEARLMRQIVGFDFHRGVLGIGRRLLFPDVISTLRQLASSQERLRLLVCPNTESAENLGLILRSAAAFGVDAVLLPVAGADPLSRRCLRQSMGSAMSLNITRSDELLRDLSQVRDALNLHLVAAVADDAESVIALNEFHWPSRSVLVMGNEYSGLDENWLRHCDSLVTIPMAPGCDSLNVSVATSILLYEMSTRSVNS